MIEFRAAGHRASFWRMALLAILLAAVRGAVMAAPEDAPVPAAGNEPAPATTVTPAATPRYLGVIGAPGLAALLQKAGCPARELVSNEVETGLFDPYSLLLINLEQPLSVAGAAFLHDYVSRGGSLIACSWCAAVAPSLQPSFPAYRLQDTLQIRVTGWSADGNAFLRAANGSALFRGIPDLLDAVHHATPLIEPGNGARVEAVWLGGDGSTTKPLPAIVQSPHCFYFASNVLAVALRSRQILRLLTNAIGVLQPTLAPEPTQLSLAELEIALEQAKRVAATIPNDAAAPQLAAALAKAATAQQLAAAAPGATLAPTQNTNAAPAASTPAAPATSAPSPSPAAIIQDAIDAAECVSLLQIPCRTTEARGVLLPRRVIPTSRAAIAQLLDRLHAVGVNLVLPEAYSDGFTLAPGPNQDPRFAGQDPLAALIAEGNARGIAVHAWISLLTGGAPGVKGSLLAGHPSWAAQTRGGARYVAGGAHWLCPSQPEVRDAVCTRIHQAISGYDVQGFYLDSLDYGGVPEACYDSNCLSLFRGDTGHNPRTESLQGEAAQDWLEWRRDRLDTLLLRVTHDLRAQRPNVPLFIGITATAVEPRSNALPDWRRWLQARLVDGVCPQIASGDPDAAGDLVARTLRLAPETTVLPIVNTERVRTSQSALALIGSAQAENATGFLFDQPAPLLGCWSNALNRGCFREAATLPWRKQ